MTRITVAIAAAALTISLGGCSRSADEPAPADNLVEASPSAEPSAVAEPTPEPIASPSATPDTNLAEAVPPAVPPAPDEQMMDDASATGMTARASRDEASANEAAPVEQVERK